jgi:anthranilate synthase component 1
MRPRTLIIHDNLKKEIFYINNIFSDEKITNYQKKYDSIKTDLFKLLVQSSIKNINTNRVLSEKKIKVKSNTSKNKFLAMVNKAKKYIKLGDIFQVVLSQRFEAKLTKKPLEIYKKLRSTNPSPFMFYFNFQDFQIIGASPEILVRLRDNKITVRPIAGTRPRGKIKKKIFFIKKTFLMIKKNSLNI